MSAKITGHNDEATDWIVLVLLLDDGSAPWSIDEIAREVGGYLTAIDSLRRLHRAGLVHTCEEFFFATRPARKFEELRA